jgi:2-oxoglutarate/2-oxoacid ferredoxin oxidoreductase subunit alpha
MAFGKSPDGWIENDFTITIGTINGSGSATANMTLLRTIFKMGVPVNGKNIFPSNIQGLPTWYTIRVSKQGFLARTEDNHIVIAMNPTTFERELKSVVPGGIFIYNEDIKQSVDRKDISIYPMPVKQILKDHEIPPNLKEYVANMVYVGVLANIIGIEMAKVREALDFHFKGKTKPIEANLAIIQSAFNWSKENHLKTDPYRISLMHETDHCIMSTGNTAAAVGAIYGGLQYCAWYPITPATGMVDSLLEYFPVLRKDPQTGKNTYAVVQAEDELAAIGMSIGAGWGGLRSMTSTSGPGLSLMAEYIGLAYFTEVPVVIWDVQRVGPSTGMPTRTAQGDITFANFIGHGDKRNILLFPANINECFEFGWKALDLAERLQTPIIVLTDLDLGMNHWMGNRFEYPDKPIDRGKILWEEDLEKYLEMHDGVWGRYLDVDGDGIPYRTVPGNIHQKSAFFARGTGHDEFARYSEDPDVWERTINRITHKIENATQLFPEPIVQTAKGAKIGIIGCGTTDDAIQEAIYQLSEKNIPTDYLRVRSIPFSNEVKKFIQQYDHVYVVELNQDKQLRQLLTLYSPEVATHLRSIAHIDGLPMTAKYIVNHLLEQEEK